MIITNPARTLLPYVFTLTGFIGTRRLFSVVLAVIRLTDPRRFTGKLLYAVRTFLGMRKHMSR